MELTIGTYVLINFILVVSSILQMATGVTVGMIIVPLLAMISYTLIPVPIAFASLALTIMMAYKGRNNIDTTNLFPIGLGMIIGILFSIFILKNIEFKYMGIVFGSAILIAVYFSIKIPTFILTKKISYTGGFIAGIMGATAAVGGKVVALLFQNHPLESLKATLAFLYTLFSVVMLVIFFAFGEFSYSQFISGVYMMPGFVIGFFVAPLFAKYFNPKYSKTAVLFMATLGSLILIGKSLYPLL